MSTPTASSREEVRRLIGAFASGRATSATPSGAGDVVVDLSRMSSVAAALTLAAAVRAQHDEEALRRLEGALLSTAAALRAPSSREADHGCDDLRAAL